MLFFNFYFNQVFILPGLFLYYYYLSDVSSFPFQDRRMLLLPLKVTDRSSESWLCKVITKSAKPGAGTQVFQKLAQFIKQLLDVIPFLCWHLLKPPH